MDTVDPAMVDNLRQLASEGHTPSHMLREVIRLSAPLTPHKLTLIALMKAAFGLSLKEASPIAGWSADGQAELTDERLDGLLGPEISRNAYQWNTAR